MHLIPANEQYDKKVYDADEIEWALVVLWRVHFK